MMGFCCVLEQRAELDIYSASSLKQQSTDRHTLDDGLLFCSRAKGWVGCLYASSLKQQSTDRHTLDDGLLLCSRTTCWVGYL